MRRILKAHWPEILVLTIVPFLIYARSVGNDFVHWDDGILIFDNPWIRGLSWANVRHAFTSYDPELYIPLTLLSYQVNFAIAGTAPWIYHLTNLALHIANVVLLWTVMLQLTRNRTAAFAAALLFAAHPLNTEAVAWAAARKDVLSVAFLFATFAAFLQFRATNDRRWLIASVALFGLGLAAKVSILTAPLVLIAMDWLQGRVTLRASLRGSIPYFALSGIFGIVSLFGKIPQSMFVYDKMLIAVRATAFFMEKMIAPWGLAMLYPYTQPVSMFTPDIALSLIAVIGATALCLWATRFDRRPLFAWFVFVIVLLPSFTNMLKGKNFLLDIYVTSDRYAYAAMFGPLLLAGWVIGECARRWKWPTIGAGVTLTVILSVMSYRQSLFWKNSETIFRRVLVVSPNSYIAHQNLGTILGKRGELQAAMKEYVEAVKIRPDGDSYYDIGQILEHNGNIELAIETYKRAVETSGDADSQARLDVLTEKQK